MACLLFIQALMMSVGLGMAAGASGPGDGFIICSASSANLKASATNDDRKKPFQHPHCPFCYVAAQSAGQVATVGDVPIFLTDISFGLDAGVYSHFIDRIVIPPLRCQVGSPRAPPVAV